MNDDKKKWKPDPDTVGSSSQLERTQGFVGNKCTFCDEPLDEDPDAPLLQDFLLVVVRKNNYRPDMTGREKYQIVLKSHHSIMEVTPKEAMAIFKARQWLVEYYVKKDPSWGGAFIHRAGNTKKNASSLPPDHYFESVTFPDGTEPVKETLCKSYTDKDKERRDDRIKKK